MIFNRWFKTFAAGVSASDPMDGLMKIKSSESVERSLSGHGNHLMIFDVLEAESMDK